MTIKPNDVVSRLKRYVQSSDYGVYEIRSSLSDWENRYGTVELNPDFQRGNVWTKDQQTKFIESLLANSVSSSGLILHFNSPYFGGAEPQNCDLPKGFQCIDGLQRLTAIYEYIDDNIKPYGYPKSFFESDFDYSIKRMIFKISIYTYYRKKDLLNHYLAINSGGTPHSVDELNRIKEMIDKLN